MLLRLLAAALFVLVAGCPRAPDADQAKASAERGARAPEPLSCSALQSCTDRCRDEACASACTRRLTATARPVYDALQACVVPACANADAGAAPCKQPSSIGCKLCVLSHCAALASRCMAN